MSGAAVLSVGLVGTFALPAYAQFEPEGQPDLVPLQSLTTPVVDGETASLIAPAVVVDDLVAERAEQERLQLEAEAARAEEEQARIEAEQVQQQQPEEVAAVETPGEQPEPAPAPQPVVAGSGVGQAIADGALGQLGVQQDCTDLVQNALAAAGLTTRRDAGGYDMGVGDFFGFGAQVASGDYAVGDILIYGGAHVAVYIGNGQAVHGGWGGNNTVIAGVDVGLGLPSVVRP